MLVREEYHVVLGGGFISLLVCVLGGRIKEGVDKRDVGSMVLHLLLREGRLGTVLAWDRSFHVCRLVSSV